VAPGVGKATTGSKVSRLFQRGAGFPASRYKMPIQAGWKACPTKDYIGCCPTIDILWPPVTEAAAG